MRVIAGEHKGRALVAPRGDTTRPTTDRVRESIMSSLESLCGSFEDLYGVDVFAGSGALGFEALSRGAAHITFSDTNRLALDALKRNASTLRYGTERATILNIDVLKRGIPHHPHGFDLAFFDPPYRLNAKTVITLIGDSVRAGTFADGCIIVYEHDDTANEFLDGIVEEEGSIPFLLHLRRKKYGATFVDYLQVRK